MRKRTLVPLVLILLAAPGILHHCFAALEQPAAAAESLPDLPRPPLPTTDDFSNVTDEAGLTGVVGFRLSVADLNGDGYPDIFAHLPQNDSTGDVLDTQYLYLNVPGDDPSNPYSRKYIDYTTESNIRADREGTGQGRHSDAAIFADVDNDGDLDIFTSVYVHSNFSLDVGRNDLLLNDGSAHFTLAPNSPFHLEPIHNTSSAVFMDYDNDGNIDLFIGNYYHPGGALSPDQLYRGHGDGSFTNVTSQAGIDAKSTCVYAVAAFDWNDDGFIDLFAPPYSRSHSQSIPVQWQNNGDGTFTQVQTLTDYDLYRGYGGRVSFGTMPWDYDDDGDFDFLEVMVHGWGDAGSGVHSTVATNNAGVFSWDFDRVTGRAAEDIWLDHHGDHYGSWTDVDNDSLVDFLLTDCCYQSPSGVYDNAIYLFRQGPGRIFTADTPSSGLDAINDAGMRSHNVLALDYDLDGDEDLLVGFASWDGIQLWRNDTGNQNNWISITLEGGGGPGQANSAAIGSRVEVTAGGKTQTRQVSAGSGHQGPQAPLSLTFGLGSATVVDSITVHWANGGQTTTVLEDVAVNQFVTIQEVEEDYVGCEIDLVNNTHTCGDLDAIAFLQQPVGGETVLRLNLDVDQSGFNRAVFDVEYGGTPSGWTVNIGDSHSNNGGGGDGWDQSNDAEVQIHQSTLTAYGKDGTPVYPLLQVNDFASAGSTVSLEVSNERLGWDNGGGVADHLASPYLYALHGQPDSEGPVNYDVYAAFNRTVYSPDRWGTGVTRVKVKLFTDPESCEIDLANNTHTCSAIDAIDFVQSPAGNRAVLRINLDPSQSGFAEALFDVEYDSTPTGWTVNIGDSSTNNGAGGDAATFSNDAEMHIKESVLELYGKDGTPPSMYPLTLVDGFAAAGSVVRLEVGNERAAWDNHAGLADEMQSPYLYALDGQPDSEGPVNYDIYAGFNRVIYTTSRYGTGVRRVKVTLIEGSGGPPVEDPAPEEVFF